jgi:hypothetical protein
MQRASDFSSPHQLPASQKLEASSGHRRIGVSWSVEFTKADGQSVRAALSIQRIDLPIAMPIRTNSENSYFG